MRMWTLDSLFTSASGPWQRRLAAFQAAHGEPRKWFANKLLFPSASEGWAAS